VEEGPGKAWAFEEVQLTKAELITLDESLFEDEVEEEAVEETTAALADVDIAVDEPAEAPIGEFAAAALAAAAAPKEVKEVKVVLTKLEKAEIKKKEKEAKAAAKIEAQKAAAEEAMKAHKAEQRAARIAKGENPCMCRGTYVCGDCMAEADE
jgi:hypothetical protein